MTRAKPPEPGSVSVPFLCAAVAALSELYPDRVCGAGLNEFKDHLSAAERAFASMPTLAEAKEAKGADRGAT